MTRISSKLTVWYKRGFPILWFGFLAIFVGVSLFSGGLVRDPIILIAPCFMGAVGFFMMKKLVWDLVDEVYEDRDALLIRNGGEEERIPMSNIMNVSATLLINPPRVTLRLVTPSRFGNEITFSPVTGLRLNPFAKNQVTEDLIEKVYKIRATRGN
jgi:hypothetical protein